MDYNLHFIDKCANTACPNRAHEGKFVMIETRELVVGGHRPLRFLMCAPCASALVAGDSSLKVGGTR